MKQCTYPDLEAMRKVDIRDIDPDTIPDIRDIKIDTEQPVQERILSYIQQVKNPYVLRCGKISCSPEAG